MLQHSCDEIFDFDAFEKDHPLDGSETRPDELVPAPMVFINKIPREDKRVHSNLPVRTPVAEGRITYQTSLHEKGRAPQWKPYGYRDLYALLKCRPPNEQPRGPSAAASDNRLRQAAEPAQASTNPPVINIDHCPRGPSSDSGEDIGDGLSVAATRANDVPIHPAAAKYPSGSRAPAPCPMSRSVSTEASSPSASRSNAPAPAPDPPMTTLRPQKRKAQPAPVASRKRKRPDEDKTPVLTCAWPGCNDRGPHANNAAMKRHLESHWPLEGKAGKCQWPDCGEFVEWSSFKRHLDHFHCNLRFAQCAHCGDIVREDCLKTRHTPCTKKPRNGEDKGSCTSGQAPQQLDNKGTEPALRRSTRAGRAI